MLCSSDDQQFDVDKKVAMMSEMVKNMMEDTDAKDAVPLPNVNGKVLARVIEYCKFHIEANKKGPDGKPFKSDEEFVTGVDQSTLFDLILAANYLIIKCLLDLTCQRVANMIKGKTPEEIRKQFNIKNDFTPEEEEEVRRENQWAFD